MTLTYKQAVDDINKMFDDVFPNEVFWESVQKDKPVIDDPWASAVIRHAIGRQDTLGGVGNRSFLRGGTFIAGIYAHGGNGLSIAYELARVSANAYEGKSSPNGVWFRDVRIQEIGRDGDWFQVNMLAEFEYYETK